MSFHYSNYTIQTIKKQRCEKRCQSSHSPTILASRACVAPHAKNGSFRPRAEMTHLLVGGNIPQAPFEQLRDGAGCAFLRNASFLMAHFYTWSDDHVCALCEAQPGHLNVQAVLRRCCSVQGVAPLRLLPRAIPRWLSDVRTFTRGRARGEDDFMFPT